MMTPEQLESTRQVIRDGGKVYPGDVQALLAHIDHLAAELARYERGGALLGEIIERHGKWLVEATNSQDLIDEDGDGDWEVVWERLFDLRTRHDHQAATIARVRALADHLHRNGHAQSCVVYRDMATQKVSAKLATRMMRAAKQLRAALGGPTP